MTDTPPSGAPVGTADHTNYRLRVTAGPSYDSSTHHTVPVNAPTSNIVENDHIILAYSVRIKDFTGLPDHSPKTSPYFEQAPSDRYCISFSFIPKVDIGGDDLVFGNDFDRPIANRLPPGFGTMLKLAKTWIDPGLYEDVYSEKPYLYGTALSSWNTLSIGDKVVDAERHNIEEWKIPNSDQFHEEAVNESSDGSGEEVRSEYSIPSDAAGRKKHFLTEAHRQEFTFEKGRHYKAGFANGYLNFNDFSLSLPWGYSLNVLKYIDSKTHELRYTLKNRKTDEVYAVILFTLLWGGELEETEKRDEEEEQKKAEHGGKETRVDEAEIPSDDDDVD